MTIVLNFMDIMSIYLGQRICTDSEYMYEYICVLDSFIVNSYLSAQDLHTLERFIVRLSCSYASV